MTTEPRELLPDELLWAEGGHASDVALTALADGQLEILPAEVRAHVEGCSSCTAHLGNAALLSLHAGHELAAARAAEPARGKVPRVAIALGLVFAVVGLLPTLLDAPSEVGTATRFATHDAPLLAQALTTLARRLSDSPFGLALTYGSALVLVAVGFALVRVLPKKEVSR